MSFPAQVPVVLFGLERWYLHLRWVWAVSYFQILRFPGSKLRLVGFRQSAIVLFGLIFVLLLLSSPLTGLGTLESLGAFPELILIGLSLAFSGVGILIFSVDFSFAFSPVFLPFPFAFIFFLLIV